MFAGECQEHIIECWPPHLDIEDINAGIVEGTQSTRHRPVPRSDRSVQMCPVIIDLDVARRELPKGIDGALQIF